MQPTPAIIAAAAEWAAELDGGDLSASRRQACETWCGEDPRHRLVLDRMRGLDSRLSRLDAAGRSTLRSALARPRSRRGGAAALCLALLVAAGVLGAQSFTARERFAGYRAEVGQVRHVDLQDGSRLDIDTGGALDASVGEGKRKVTLYRGQILAHVAPARGAFVVETRHATATALGTAYVVRDEGGSTLVTVIESTVRVCARAQSEACLTLKAGERARATRTQVARLPAVDPGAAAGWATGWLEADDQPIAEVLAELNRYRTRPVAFDAGALAGLRVTGAFPLEDSDRALKTVTQTARLRTAREPDGTLSLSR